MGPARRPPLLLPLLLLLWPPAVLAAEAGDELGSWWMYFGQNRIGRRSSIHTEAQLRLWEVTSNFNQLLIRVGYNWDIDEKNMASGGYALIETEPFEGEGDATEHRLWQQYIQRAGLGRRVSFEHRFRLEERWIDGPERTDFRLRGRYRILVNVALGDPAASPYLLSFYDEVFLGISTGDPFEQNRLYGAFGYKVSKRSQIQVGYLLNSFPEDTYGRLQFAWFFNPDLRKR
ncbi:MAG: DUF2490 domain-containing protein [Acidobacteriota bacterium]